jgi:hypothetical protein
MILATPRWISTARDEATHPRVNYGPTRDWRARVVANEAKLAYCGNVMIERNGLCVDTELLQCYGTAERDAAMMMGVARGRHRWHHAGSR